MIRSVLIAIGAVLLLGITGCETGDGETEKREDVDLTCKPAPGPPPAQCSEYAANADWLPPAYVRNAFCACSKTPDSPTANCVRGFLRDKTENSPELKKKWGDYKKKHSDGLIEWAEYEAYIVEHITPVIYEWHKDAYASCCCPAGPAPYLDWIGVTTVNLENCDLVDEMINLFGSCHGTPGHW